MSTRKAKLLICPVMSRPVFDGIQAILYELDCRADMCPMWRFDSVENDDVDRLEREGYCGMAGPPEFL